MAPVNPYLRKPCKKQGSSQAAASLPSLHSKTKTSADSTGSIVIATTARPPKKKPSHQQRRSVASAPTAAASLPPSLSQVRAIAPVAPKSSSRPSTAQQQPNAKPPSIVVANSSKARPLVTAKSKQSKLSFKSKLKQEIQSLKRAKELERQRKIQETKERQKREELTKQQEQQQAQMIQQEQERIDRDKRQKEALLQKMQASQEQQARGQVLSIHQNQLEASFSYGQRPPFYGKDGLMDTYHPSVAMGYPVQTANGPKNFVTPAKSVATNNPTNPNHFPRTSSMPPTTHQSAPPSLPLSAQVITPSTTTVSSSARTSTTDIDMRANGATMTTRVGAPASCHDGIAGASLLPSCTDAATPRAAEAKVSTEASLVSKGDSSSRETMVPTETANDCGMSATKSSANVAVKSGKGKQGVVMNHHSIPKSSSLHSETNAKNKEVISSNGTTTVTAEKQAVSLTTIAAQCDLSTFDVGMNASHTRTNGPTIHMERHGIGGNEGVHHSNNGSFLSSTFPPPPPQYAYRSPYPALPQMMQTPMHNVYAYAGWMNHPFHLYQQQQAMMMHIMGGAAMPRTDSMTPPTFGAQPPPQLLPQTKRSPSSTVVSSLPRRKPPAAVLHRNPLHAASPYATTHNVAPIEELVIFKEQGKSFGVSFAYESSSALVHPALLADLDSSSQSPLESDKAKVKKETATASFNAVISDTVDDKKLCSTTLKEETKATASRMTTTTIDAVHSSASTKATITAMPAEATANGPGKQKQRRRRRVFFGVLKVVTAEKQNASFNKEPTVQLRPGDIVLKINGHDLGGLTFPQAISLFASCNASPNNDSDSNSALVRCPLVVARKKPDTTANSSPQLALAAPTTSHFGYSKPQTIPFVVDTTTNQVLSGDFSNVELLGLAQGALQCVFSNARALGHEATADLEKKCLEGPALKQRDFSSIKAKQSVAFRSFERSMEDSAKAHWGRKWNEEEGKMGTSDVSISHLSDAQRSAMRELPRPTKGCRCGVMSHEYVSDRKCILYRNLRILSEMHSEPGVEGGQDARKSKNSNLNAVETAFKDRILRLKEVTEKEEKEARFVQDMEELQVNQLKMAVFAPNLTTMVLSAVAELENEVPKVETLDDDRIGIRPSPQSASQTQYVALPKENRDADDSIDDDDDDDDDDDVPLVALCKSTGPSAQEPAQKRLKIDGSDGSSKANESRALDLSFLAKVLRHLSHTWGHLYAEPSDADYSWRWEVHHGQTSSGETRRDSKLRNPRRPESRSLENIRFALSDEIVARLSRSERKQQDQSKAKDNFLEASSDLLLVSHLLSPKRTGVYDEVMALMKMGVLRRTRNGFVVLAEDWHSHVDALLLDGMMQHWSKQVDPMNKHCVNKRMRDELEKVWSRVDEGWAFSSDLEDVVYDDDEWDEWRRHFHDRFAAQINEDEGIEKFGI